VPVYLDHNATSPLDVRVLDAMRPFLTEYHGNPSSTHRFGRVARTAIDQSREQVAALVNAHPNQVIFTSGGTEANNLAIKGFAGAMEPGLLVFGATEHPSVVEPAKSLKHAGWELSQLPVDGQGRLIEVEMDQRLQHRPALVSVMWANNETGVVHDIAGIASKVRTQDGVVHTDAVQAAGKIAIDFAASGVHMMTLSAHKLGGPKGVGALIVDKSVSLSPLLQGGGQEQDRRSGTENVSGIVGFGAAAEFSRSELAERRARMQKLRDRLESELHAISNIEIFGERSSRLPNTVCFGLRGVDGETLLLNLDRAGVAVSSGSACSSTHREPSPVLLAMGIDPEVAQSAIRVSFGAGNTEQDVDDFLTALMKQLQQLARISGRIAG